MPEVEDVEQLAKRSFVLCNQIIELCKPMGLEDPALMLTAVSAAVARLILLTNANRDAVVALMDDAMSSSVNDDVRPRRN